MAERKFKKSEVISDKILAEQEKNKEFATSIDKYKLGIEKLMGLAKVVFVDLEKYFGKQEISYDLSFYDKCKKAVEDINLFFKKYPELLKAYSNDLEPAQIQQGFKIDDLFEEKYLAIITTCYRKMKEMAGGSKIIFTSKETVDVINEIVDNVKNINHLNIPEQILFNSHIAEFQEQYEYLLGLDKRIKEQQSDGSKAGAKSESQAGILSLDSFLVG